MRTPVEAETAYGKEVLEDAGIGLSTIASRILGRSGRAMIDALIAESGISQHSPIPPRRHE